MLDSQEFHSPDNGSDNRAATLPLASRIVAGKIGEAKPAEIRNFRCFGGFAFIALLSPILMRGDETINKSDC